MVWIWFLCSKVPFLFLFPFFSFLIGFPGSTIRFRAFEDPSLFISYFLFHFLYSCFFLGIIIIILLLFTPQSLRNTFYIL